MLIKFYLDAKMNHNIAETKSVEVTSLDVNMVEIINSLISYQHSYISFEDYFSDKLLMNYGRCFPYIIKDNKFGWNAPYNEVTIEDFIRTTGISTDKVIHVQVDYVGGRGDDSIYYEIVTWIQNFWSIYGGSISAFVDIVGLFDIVIKTVKFFNKNRTRPKANNVKEAVLKKEKWAEVDIKQHLGMEEELLDKVMTSFGYYKDAGYYILKRDLNSKWDDFLCVDCWKLELVNEKYSQVMILIHKLDEALTCLAVQSKALGLEYFDTIMKKVDYFINKTNNVLIKGKGLNLIDINYNSLELEQSRDCSFVKELETALYELYQEVEKYFEKIFRQYC